MKQLLVGLVLVASSLVSAHSAQAGFIVGSQAFISTGTVSAPGNNVNNTTFAFTFSTLPGGTNQTGDYLTTAGTFVNLLNTTTPGAFVFGSAAYGTFVISSVNLNLLSPNIARTLNFSGTFYPGAATFGASAQPSPGDLTITINQARRGVLSASATLSTDVPEPSSLVLLGMFAAPLAARLAPPAVSGDGDCGRLIPTSACVA